jgi:hypothetical protein
MSPDQAGVGRWRDGGPSRRPPRTGSSSASKWLGTAGVSALLAVAVGVFGWIAFQVWFAPTARPYFVPLWVGPYDGPEIPPIAWQDADRRAVLDDQVFMHAAPDAKAADGLTLEVTQDRLDQLAGRPRDEAVVVYLSAYAIVDDDKKVRILTSDSNPYLKGSQLPLSWVLGRLKQCPAKNKLLVLDIMRGMIDPRDVGATADGVGDLLARELEDSTDSKRLNDPGLMVIAACGPGQVALGSEAKRHSVFGYYFHRGLTTLEADADGDLAVSVRDLGAYLAKNVDAWARRHRGAHQRPMLLGREQGDFVLAAPQIRRTPGTIVKADAVLQSKEEAKVDTASATKTKEPPGADAEKTKANESVAGSASEYPDWLSKAWTTAEGWWNTRYYRDAPRIYRRLARELVRAELRWRGGEPDASIRRDLDKTVADLTLAMKAAQEIPRPKPDRSVMHARNFDAQPVRAFKDAVTELLRLRDRHADDSPEMNKAMTEKLAKFADKTALDLAGALVDATEEEIFDRKTLEFLNRIVEQCPTVPEPTVLPRDIMELRFLKQLADRARIPGEWKPDVVRMAWRTVLSALLAQSQPDSMAWVETELDRAQARLHEAKVLLLPQAANFASWNQIAKAWEAASAKYELVAGQQKALREARAVLSEALAALVSLIPYLDATPTAELQSEWLDAVDLSGDLARMLKPPDAPGSSEAGSAARLSAATDKLKMVSAKLLAPFRPSAVQAIVERCRSEVPPNPALAAQIDAVLLTPFLRAADRRSLYDAQRALDERLEKTSRPGETAGSSVAEEGGQPDARARRRFERMAAMLKLAGDATTSRLVEEFVKTAEHSSQRKASTVADLTWDMSDPAIVWGSMARFAKLTYNAFADLLRSDARPDLLDRAGWLAPDYLAVTSNPTRVSRERAADHNWAWLAAQYRHESRDLTTQSDADGVLELAARQCPTESKPVSEVALKIDIDDPSSPIQLSPRQPTATAKLRLILTGVAAAAAQKVKLEVLEPEDPRLNVGKPEPAALDVSPSQPATVSLELKLSDDPARSQVPPPSGLVVRAYTPDEHTYHALVPVKIVSAGMFPKLALSRSPAECDDLPMDRIRLRPIAKLRQQYYLFAKNPSDRPWGVIVELWDGNKKLASAGSKAKPLEVKAQPSLPVLISAFDAPPAPKPGSDLNELVGPLRFKTMDATTGTVLDEQTLGVDIAAPDDYLEVVRAEFTPGQRNRLAVVVRPRPGRALPEVTGHPCKVELVLPLGKEFFPTLRESPAGTLVGELTSDNPELTLFAENIVLDPNNDATGAFYLKVDGVDRAQWYQSRFPQHGPPQKASLRNSPHLSFVATPKVKPKQAELEIAFTVDDAPAGAQLEFRLHQLGDGNVPDDLNRRYPAKRRHKGFDPGGEGGALLFEASIDDQRPVLPVTGVIGWRNMKARLLKETGDQLDVHEEKIVLDDTLPTGMSVMLPPQITRGSSVIPVRGSAKSQASRIKEVAFIFGPKEEFDKAVAENRVVKGIEGPEGREWSAKLIVPKDKEAAAKLVVTARFTTGLGLADFKEAEIAVIDPKPEDMKPAAPKPGAIMGTVKVGDLAQPDLDVLLCDPKPAPGKPQVLAAAKTDANGAFSFKDLAPKDYQIYCKKVDGIFNRAYNNVVTVEAGKTLTLELGLTAGAH